MRNWLCSPPGGIAGTQLLDRNEVKSRHKRLEFDIGLNEYLLKTTATTMQRSNNSRPNFAMVVLLAHFNVRSHSFRRCRGSWKKPNSHVNQQKKTYRLTYQVKQTALKRRATSSRCRCQLTWLFDSGCMRKKRGVKQLRASAPKWRLYQHDFLGNQMLDRDWARGVQAAGVRRSTVEVTHQSLYPYVRKPFCGRS